MAAPAVRSALLQTLLERGFLYQCTDLDGLDALALEGPITGYIGFDCTADSLHVGHLVQIMMLRHLQRHGHRPIVVVGGGTTKIGDPSGKDQTRRLISQAEIDRNAAGIRKIFDRFLEFGDGPSGALMVDNAEWLDRLELIPFLRDVGRHFSVNRMLALDSVKLRLEREQPLTFIEFNYMILQAYDFVELARRHDCRLQLSGSDQWGNIVNGIDLGRRVLERELFGFTSPLITTASGAKMGKTADGAVWLNADRVSPYDYWQFWRNTDDGDVVRFLKLFTELPLDEIRRLETLEGAAINEAKKLLATAATALVHGSDAAREAAAAADRIFDEGTLSDALPTVEVSKADLAAGLHAFELLARTGLAASKSEARRLIKSGGARLDDRPIADEFFQIGLGAFDDAGTVKLSAGKKRHALVKLRD